jgi:2-iminobutanoate/2-iminopropanoate deaminase
VRWESLVFTAGQVGLDPASGKPVEGGVQEQTRQVLKNVQAVLEAGGSSLENVVKTTCFLADINDFAAFNEVYQEFFPGDRPARSTVQVGLPSPWRVEIEAIGIRS